MFVELMPLLAGRTVLITVAKVDDKTLRVNVIPHGKADDNPALSTPLTYTGSPEELDAELGEHLAGSSKTDLHTASPLERQTRLPEPGSRSARVRLTGPAVSLWRNQLSWWFHQLGIGNDLCAKDRPAVLETNSEIEQAPDAVMAATGGWSQWQSQRRKSCWPGLPNLRNK